MQSLALPRPTLLSSTPFGRPEPEDGLAKFRSKFSPTRPEQQSYPSPPMSESHSPTRRPAHHSEVARFSYPPSVDASHRSDAGLPLPPPHSSLHESRSSFAGSSGNQQRSLYPGESHYRAQPVHYQSGRVVEPHGYGNASIPPSYGYGYPSHGLPQYPGAQHSGPIGQPAAMIAPPTARPTKPARRTKAHVASACVNCKKAHLSCDVQRPCGRCVASGKQDTCKDVQHKKRGRPRLRDDREFSRPDEGRQHQNQHQQASTDLPTPETHPRQPSFTSTQPHQVPGLSRIDGSVQVQPALKASPQTNPSSTGRFASDLGKHGRAAVSSYRRGSSQPDQSLPVAFLNLDLVIQKSNEAFSDLVAFLGDVRGKHLGDLLEARQFENLQRLRNELRDERDEREPTYMAPITPVGLDPMRAVMDSVSDKDIEHVTQGSRDRPMFLSFRKPSSGEFQSLQVSIRLAKTTLYFVTLVVRSPSQLMAPSPSSSLLTKQLAPPTPQGPLQTQQSAPVTAAPPPPPLPPHFTPLQARPRSSAGSAPNSPFFSFSSVRTSLPTFSPNSYSSSPSYGYSPNAGPESGYFSAMRPPSQPTPSAYPLYPSSSRNPSTSSEPRREIARPARLEGLHLPPIRTGPAPLGSPLHMEVGERPAERGRVRPREPCVTSEQSKPETPENGKRRRLNIHEVLE